MKKRLVVGLSGASGAILCVSLLEAMRREKDWEVHLVTSEAGERVLHEETGMSGTDLAGLAFRTHDIGNIGAAIASGTFETEGMAVVPCSMKTLAGICHGYAENLLLRAADVTLKERRKLVLVAYLVLSAQQAFLKIRLQKSKMWQRQFLFSIQVICHSASIF